MRGEQDVDASELERRQAGRVTAGIVLIVVGGLFMLDRAGMLDVADFGRNWPFILIALGVGKLLGAHGDHGRLRGAAWLLFLGGLFLMHEHGVLRLGRSWPLFLVAIGLGIIWKSLASRPARVTSGERPHDV
jgi:hypothetical protein